MNSIQLAELQQTSPYYRGAQYGCNLLLSFAECSDNRFVASLIIEAGSRLKQLQIIEDRLQKSLDGVSLLEAKLDRIHKKSGLSIRLIRKPSEIELLSKLTLQQETAILDAECCYTIGFCLIDISRAINKSILGIQPASPSEPSGVRDVRNKLISHPERNNPLPIMSWSFRITRHDVYIRSGRHESEIKDFIDKGMKHNKEELRLWWIDWITMIHGKMRARLP